MKSDVIPRVDIRSALKIDCETKRKRIKSSRTNSSCLLTIAPTGVDCRSLESKTRCSIIGECDRNTELSDIEMGSEAQRTALTYGVVDTHRSTICD